MAAKLGWGVDLDDKEEKIEDAQSDMKRKASNDNIDEDVIDVKRCKNEDTSEESIAAEDGVIKVPEAPYFLEKLRLAQTILENRQKNETKDFKMENVLPRVATPRQSQNESNLMGKSHITSSESFHSKQPMVNSNSKLLDKVGRKLSIFIFLFS